jgi:hypothetical protein
MRSRIHLAIPATARSPSRVRVLLPVASLGAASGCVLEPRDPHRTPRSAGDGDPRREGRDLLSVGVNRAFDSPEIGIHLVSVGYLAVLECVRQRDRSRADVSRLSCSGLGSTADRGGVPACRILGPRCGPFRLTIPSARGYPRPPERHWCGIKAVMATSDMKRQIGS